MQLNLPPEMHWEPETDAARMNAVANHPSVYPFIKGPVEGPLDVSPVLRDPRNRILMGEYGGVIFTWIEPGVYLCHTNVLPEGRGHWALEQGRRAFSWMFLNTDAVEILTQCPVSNPRAAALAKAAGFVFEFPTRAVWPIEGGVVSAHVYSLSIEKWAREAQQMARIGHDFHEMLQKQYDEQGKTLAVHDEDPVHDQYAGITAAMIACGMVDKAINFYNRWARASWYAPISLVSREPLVLDILESRLKITGNSFEVQ